MEGHMGLNTNVERATLSASSISRSTLYIVDFSVVLTSSVVDQGWSIVRVGTWKGNPREIGGSPHFLVDSHLVGRQVIIPRETHCPVMRGTLTGYKAGQKHTIRFVMPFSPPELINLYCETSTFPLGWCMFVLFHGCWVYIGILCILRPKGVHLNGYSFCIIHYSYAVAYITYGSRALNRIYSLTTPEQAGILSAFKIPPRSRCFVGLFEIQEAGGLCRSPISCNGVYVQTCSKPPHVASVTYSAR